MRSENSTRRLSGGVPRTPGRINVEEYTTAMLNILEDFTGEKDHLEDAHRAALNILEDFAAEKARLEDTQRAMLNLLEDFGMEREKMEAVNRELRKAEEQIKKSLREKEALLKEIHHRVKNNLQLICSMLNLQLPFIKDPQAIEIFKESQTRIYSMALIHEKLYRSESMARIDLSEYIPSLIDNLFLSYGVTESTIRARMDVKNVDLSIDKVIPCALIINELVSNSLKHAFPGLSQAGGTGELNIDLHPAVENEILLIVRDNGVGLPQGFEIQKCESLGLKLVSVLAKQLQGEIQIHSNGGTEFAVRFKAR